MGQKTSRATSEKEWAEELEKAQHTLERLERAARGVQLTRQAERSKLLEIARRIVNVSRSINTNTEEKK